VFTPEEWTALGRRLALSPREAAIVRLLCDGHKNFSAAKELGISPETLRTHLKRLYEKLDVSDRFELLCLLVRTLRGASPAEVSPEKGMPASGNT